MISVADHSDIAACLEMGRRFHAQTPVAPFIPFDSDSVSVLLKSLIEGDESVLLIAKDQEGSPFAMIGMIAYPHYLNQDHKVAQELFWWVDEEKRGGTAAIRLLQRAEQWAKQKECSAVLMLSLAIDSPADDIYRRSGYSPLERCFVKEL